MQEMRGPSSGGVMGATTAIVWIKRDDDPGEVLFYGTQEGYIVRWRQSTVRICHSDRIFTVNGSTGGARV